MTIYWMKLLLKMRLHRSTGHLGRVRMNFFACHLYGSGRDARLQPALPVVTCSKFRVNLAMTSLIQILQADHLSSVSLSFHLKLRIRQAKYHLVMVPVIKVKVKVGSIAPRNV